MNRKTIFWDVDTQFDFMDPAGALYVPGAETIIDKVSRVRRFALENGFSIVASTDWHSREDPEISESPDKKNTFPPHCIADTPGSRRVGYLGDVPIDYIHTEPLSDKRLHKIVGKSQFHIVLRKQAVGVFSNPNTEKLIGLLQPCAFAVFGVALDVCVYSTVLGLAQYPDLELYLITDAVKGLGIKNADEVFGEFLEHDVKLCKFDELKERLKCG